MDDPIVGRIPDGYKAPPKVRTIREWGEPDEDGIRAQKSHVEFDGDLFPYLTSGEKLVHDLVPNRPEFGKVVYIPIVAASYEDVPYEDVPAPRFPPPSD